MVTLSAVHYIYILMVVVILATMMLKKDIVIPCIVGVLIIGIVFTGSFVRGVQVVYSALLVSGTELLDIILIIGLVVAMSEALKAVGADRLMVKPMQRLMVGPMTTYFLLGGMMLVVAWVIWPSPAVALIGAMIVPAALQAGLPAIWVAVAMNLWGHGMALSSDFFIQGAPSITASAAGIESSMITDAIVPLWLTMSVVTVGTSFWMMRKELRMEKKLGIETLKDSELDFVTAIKEEKPASTKAKWIAIGTPVTFLLVFIAMVACDIKGSDATALVGGTLALIVVVVTLVTHGIHKGLDEVGSYMKQGLGFGIKIFGPVIIIGAFFFIGNEETAKVVLGPEATGLLSDIGLYIAQHIPLSPAIVAVGQAAVGGITGLDGSGFSGLPLVGSLAQTFANMDMNSAVLGALGQLTAIWVGGGTIIPWGGIVAVAAICNVSPVELARKNLVPVVLGFVATTGVAIWLLLV